MVPSISTLPQRIALMHHFMALLLQAEMYMHHWNFPLTYVFGKNLAEKLVDQYAREHGLPTAIVRPSFVMPVAKAPYVGYVGNVAGQSGGGGGGGRWGGGGAV